MSASRRAGEDISHKSVAADLAHTLGAEDVSDSALALVEKLEKSRVLRAEAVEDAFADVERNALKDLARCDSATVKLGGIENYHIARAEGV